MTPANEKILICPYCGGEKGIIQLASGNTFDGTQWWDLKSDFPMLPQPSPIQKCPHCGKYYHIASVSSRTGTKYSFDKGILSYKEAKEAWAQLKNELQNNQLTSLALVYIHAYNDKYQRITHEKIKQKRFPTPKASDIEEFRSVVRVIISTMKVESPLIFAEFLREAGLFDEAMEIVNSTNPPEEGVYANLRKNIIDNCNKKNTLVYTIDF